MSRIVEMVWPIPALSGYFAASWFAVALLAMPAAFLALPAVAKEGDTFQPFVSLGYFHDNNLFRLADNELPGTPRDDRYSLLKAGLNVDWKYGRQQVVVNASKSWVRYDRNTVYDTDGNDYLAAWNWRLGNRLSGNLGAAESLSQSAFDNVGQVNNLVTRKRRFGRIEWEFHPRWQIGGGSSGPITPTARRPWPHRISVNRRTILR